MEVEEKDIEEEGRVSRRRFFLWSKSLELLDGLIICLDIRMSGSRAPPWTVGRVLSRRGGAGLIAYALRNVGYPGKETIVYLSS